MGSQLLRNDIALHEPRLTEAHGISHHGATASTSTRALIAALDSLSIQIRLPFALEGTKAIGPGQAWSRTIPACDPVLTRDPNLPTRSHTMRKITVYPRPQVSRQNP